MDHVLSVADRYVLTPFVYPASWPEDEPLRQIISLLLVTNLGAQLLYLGFGALSFYFVFDHKLMKHPQFMKVGCLTGRGADRSLQTGERSESVSGSFTQLVNKTASELL